MTEKKDRPQNKNLRPHPENLGVRKLKKGEESVLVRVRGSQRAVAWFTGLGSEERGKRIERLYMEES